MCCLISHAAVLTFMSPPVRNYRRFHLLLGENPQIIQLIDGLVWRRFSFGEAAKITLACFSASLPDRRGRTRLLIVKSYRQTEQIAEGMAVWPESGASLWVTLPYMGKTLRGSRADVNLNNFWIKRRSGSRTFLLCLSPTDSCSFFL